MFFKILVLAICTFNVVFTENMYLIDIEPAKARQLITNRIVPLRPKYADLVSENVPVLRNVNGRQVEIKENIYQAAQAHGQDGEGSYGYMYSNPFDAKVETRSPNGVVQGMYQYRLPDGQEVLVKYIGDENGIQITDNLNHEPVKETEEVRIAREQHEQAMREAVNRIQDSKTLQERQQEQQQSQFKKQSSYDFKDYKDIKSDPIAEYSEKRETKTRTPESIEEISYPPHGFYYEISHPSNSLTDESVNRLKSL